MDGQLNDIIHQLIHYHDAQPMFYTGIAFWVAFALILGLYSLLYRKNTWRNIYLLAVSWYIYFQMNGAFLSLLVFSGLANYGLGLSINKFRKNYISLVLAIGFNLALLFYFKYAYFFTETVNNSFHTNYIVFNWLGWFLNQLSAGMADVNTIILPIGISFYTFQAISYLVDVHQRRVGVVRNPIDFCFYLSFFPQLVAGPIIRAAAFIPQLYQKYQLSKEEFSHAIFLILKGLLKKLIIADFLALNLVDRVFAEPGAYSGLENLLGIYAYSVQIYCDFSGYTDIAIGLALILGFKIPVNFNTPYRAASLSDFWHRWHISLSLWLRDYLYIPLGGNRKGKLRMHVNLIVTMLLGGFWHGASWQFVIWGALHGIGLSLEKLWKSIFPGKSSSSGIKRFLSIMLTFQIVSLAWVFFRADDMRTVHRMYYQLTQHFMPQLTREGISAYGFTLYVLAFGFVLIWFPFSWKEKMRGWFINLPMGAQIILAAVLILLIQTIAGAQIQPFIYFRF